MGDIMTIYEIQCPFCDHLQLIDSRKHMFRRYETPDDEAAYVQCQANLCVRLFRVASYELKAVQEPIQHNPSGG